MMPSLLNKHCLLVMLMFIVGCAGQFKDSRPMPSKENMKGCTLNPAMDVRFCKLSDDNIKMDETEGNKDQAYAQVGRDMEGPELTKTLALRMLSEDGQEKIVSHGTTCELIPENSGNTATAYKCRNGVWTISDPNRFDLTRVKKSEYKIISYPSCRRKCSRCWWRWRCRYVCVTHYKRDYTPTITCPVIEDVYTDSRQIDARVEWPPATAHDREDGVLGPDRIEQTQGQNPNSRLVQGDYTVSYQAKDRQGSTATCLVTFKVIVRTCPIEGNSYSNSFMYLPNGSLFCSHNNIYGSVCKFTCHPYYELVGSSEVECQENGVWAHEKPICKIRVCQEPPPVVRGHWTACSRHTAGSQCTLVCDPTYNVLGSTTITCQADETWTTPGICQDLEVPAFICPEDISVLSLPKKQPVPVTWIMPNATDNSGDPVKVTSSHSPGELFPAGNTTVVFQARDTSDNLAVCSMRVEVRVEYCSQLLAPPEGQVSCSHGYAVGSECSITCPEGYQLIGVMTRTCQDNKTWDGSQPSCERVNCGSPPYVAGGDFYCADGYLYGDTCSLNCNAGYLANSPLTITCESTSQWSVAGSCTDIEAPKFPKGCPDVSKYASVLGQPTYVIYPTPEVTDNSGDDATVTADITSGSEFEVGFTNVTFTAEDMSGNAATCHLTVNVIQIECINPVNSDIDNSEEKVMRFSCPDGYVFGASCSISCADNSLSAGPSSIKCEQDGTSIGYWWYGNVKPFCNAKPCPPPEEPTYGSTACDTLGDREICVVLCQEGHSFPKMSLQNGAFLCLLSTGNWIPRAISSTMCFPSRPPSHLEVMPDIYYYSEACSADSEEIKRKFITIINSIPLFSNVCGSQNVSCVVDTVRVSCGERAKRSVDATRGDFVDSWNPRNKRSLNLGHGLRNSLLLLRSKRDVDSATHLTKVEFEVKVSFTSQGDASETIGFYNDLTFDLNEHLNEATASGEFDIPEAGETHEYSFGFGDGEFKCPEPTLFQAQTAMCAGCGKGYIYVSQSAACMVCPVGTYQPENEGTECLSCPDGYSTKTDASNSTSDCLALCVPGTYSKTGMEPCDKCRRGSYQADTAKDSCDLCPYGMSTVADGATSMNDCKFYEIKLDNNSYTLDLSWEDRQLISFTAVTWVKLPRDLIDTKTSFSLTEKPGDASLGCGDFTIYISVSEDLERRNRRQWNHLALIMFGNTITLFVNGAVKDTMQLSILCPELQFNFRNSAMLDELVLTELQISNKSLTSEEVTSMSFSCNHILEGNFLALTEKIIDSLVTQSSCDDMDNCIDSPCGSKGVCIDLKDSYRCECDGLWSGNNCEIEPDFCVGHNCQNEAVCVNQVQDSNYTCECTQEYRGVLCSEKIVHGGWSIWSNWTDCSATCDNGTRSHSRTCDNPIPGPDGKMCEGADEETEICFLRHCPVNGGFGKWTDWVCPVTCGEGASTRTRECNNPAPAYGGNDCVGALVEAKDCDNLEPCPIDGAYGNFTDWSACSKSCAGGTSTRERTCDSPVPQYGGLPCDPDIAKESKSCNVEECPVCKSLIRPKNAETINCSYDEMDDMKECQIVCRKGYFTDEDKTYICGRATNFTWSHVTKENKRGRLPGCEEGTVPDSLSLDVSMTYQVNEDVNSDTVVTSVENKLLTSINCTNCSYKVSKISNTSSRKKRAPGVDASMRKKRNADSVEIAVVLDVQMPNPGLDIGTASDEEIKKQADSLQDFEDAAQKLAEESNNIFEVSYDNKTLMPDVSSVQNTVEIKCPEGTEAIDGACVNCGAGFYSISSNSLCQLCPEGFYQDLIKSTSCKQCPADTSTAGVGARSLDECLEDPTDFFPDYVEYVGLNPGEDETDTEGSDRKPKTDEDDEDEGLIIGLIAGSIALVVLVIVGVFVFFKYSQNNGHTGRVTPHLFNLSAANNDALIRRPTTQESTLNWSMESL